MSDDALPMSFESPESSLVKSASYDPGTHALIVELAPNKSTLMEAISYQYQVAPKIWEEFLHAESKGAYFSRHIRPLYIGKKVKMPETTIKR